MCGERCWNRKWLRLALGSLALFPPGLTSRRNYASGCRLPCYDTERPRLHKPEHSTETWQRMAGYVALT
jgi:hypothetical protein